MLTTYNQRTEQGTTLHQTTTRTHDEIARQLGLPLMLVSTVREVLTGTSSHARRALEECDGDPTKAAVWLAEFRRLYRVAGLITPEVVKQVEEMS